MIEHSLNRIVIDAAQWDGSKEGLEALKLVFGIGFYNVSFRKDGSVREWLIGNDSENMQPVLPGNWIVRDLLNNITIVPDL